MKTPKDILFARHSPVEPKLDAIRQEVMAQVCDQHAPKKKLMEAANQPEGVISFLRALFLSKPQVWAGLAAVWILIFALKISTHDGSQVVAKRPPLSREAIAELRQQRLFFAELAGLREVSEAEPPKSTAPRPRSERRHETTLV